MARALFYFYKNVHVPILLPIAHAMNRTGGFEIAFALHPYDREIRAGLLPEEEAALRKQPFPFVRTPQEWNADVTLIADNVAPLVENGGKIVNVGHGLLSKGQYFTDSGFIHRENLEHLLCVPGPYHKRRIEESGKVFIPVAATGMAKLDPLFNGSFAPRDVLMRRLRLDPAKKVVLYAPTFNPELSAIPILWTRVRALADDDTYLLIKLHPSTPPEFSEAHLRLADNHPNILFIADLDLVPYMQMADVMLSDVSSAFMEFILLDKPVVLFNNPNVGEYPNYDPRDIEYAWRDVGVEASTFGEVVAAVRHCLAHPGEKAERRRRAAEQLLVARDGRSSQRIVQAVRDLLAGRYDPVATLAGTTVVFIPVEAGRETAAGEAADVALARGGDHAQVVLVDRGGAGADFAPLRAKWGDRLRVLPPEGAGASSLPPGTVHIVYLAPGTETGDRWLFRLVNHLRRDPGLAAVLPMIPGGSPAQDPAQRIGLGPGVVEDALELDRQVKSALVAQTAPLHGPPHTDVWAARAGTPAADILLEQARSGRPPAPGAFERALLALDVVVRTPRRAPVDLDALRPPLAPGQREAVERRVEELAAWIGRIVPRSASGPAPSTPAGPATRGKNGNGSGHLRLALHFEKRGRPAEALRHLRAAWEENPGDEEVLALAGRLGVDFDEMGATP